MLSVRRHYPKRGRFTENLSIYLSSPAPNSSRQNPSNFGATASHWLLYILFFFFLILTGWMRGALCVATRLYILYLAADESISGWEFLLLIPKSPQFQSAVIFMNCWIMEFKICIFWQHFFVNTNLIKHNKHFLSTYFLLDPFVLPSTRIKSIHSILTVKTLLHSSNMRKQKLHHFCNRSSPDDGPKSTESTRDTYNNGQYINQFPPNTIKAIRQYERIQKKICRQKISIMFNEICINEEMLPIYI